jgi:RNA polymerase sigma-70 factor (ECF subfamily)
MPEPDSFHDVMERLKAGDDDAGLEVFERFARRLFGLVRIKLDSRLRAKVDPGDVVDSVYRTFFRRHKEGEFNFDGWNKVWGLLACITVRKCARLRRQFRDRSHHEASLEGKEPGDDWASRDPDPVEVVTAAELMEALLHGLDDRDRAIVELRLQEVSPQRISQDLDRPLRTVHRVLARIKRRLQRLAAQEQGSE